MLFPRADGLTNEGAEGMDPIKVDFTKKKDDGIIIKPAKAGLKIFLNILITLIGGALPITSCCRP